MKFSIHLVLLFVVYSNCFSQNVVVSSAKVNVLYADVENPFEYAVNNMNCKNYQLTSNNGTIICNDSCHCSINPINVGTTIIYIKDKKGKLIDSSVYRTKDLPDPVLYYSFGHRYSTRNFKIFKGLQLTANEQTKQLIESLKYGEAVYIENVIVIQPNCRERKIAGIAFKID